MEFRDTFVLKNGTKRLVFRNLTISEFVIQNMSIFKILPPSSSCTMDRIFGSMIITYTIIPINLPGLKKIILVPIHSFIPAITIKYKLGLTKNFIYLDGKCIA